SIAGIPPDGGPGAIFSRRSTLGRAGRFVGGPWSPRRLRRQAGRGEIPRPGASARRRRAPPHAWPRFVSFAPPPTSVSHANDYPTPWIADWRPVLCSAAIGVQLPRIRLSRATAVACFRFGGAAHLALAEAIRPTSSGDWRPS